VISHHFGIKKKAKELKLGLHFLGLALATLDLALVLISIMGGYNSSSIFNVCLCFSFGVGNHGFGFISNIFALGLALIFWVFSIFHISPNIEKVYNGNNSFIHISINI
jgi:hypothetical protein